MTPLAGRLNLLAGQSLQGQCHEIFCFWFFSWISFPQAPEYTIRAVSNFFENSRRYSQLKVDHRYQRQAAKLPPVSTTPAANLPPVSTTPAANFATSFTRVVDTIPLGPFRIFSKIRGDIRSLRLTTGINDRRQICHRCQRYRRQICHRC